MSCHLQVRRARILVAILLIPALAACSSPRGASPVPASGGDGSTSGSSTSSSAPAARGSDVCTSIPQTDVQELLAFPITSTADNSTFYDCTYQFSGGTQVFSLTWDPGDAGLDSYNNLKGNADHAVSSIGDMAYWNEAVADHTSPDLEAHKGNATCTIQSNDPPDITMKTTPASGIYQFTVTDADALAYVQLMGKVCNDIFGALGQ
jgi:hypothetical protein